MSWPADVVAQNADGVDVLLERIGRLERDIRSLNLSLARGAPAPTAGAPEAGSTAAPAPGSSDAGGYTIVRLSARLSALENDLRTSTGAMEEFTYQLGVVAKRLDKLVADVDFRLGVLEGRTPGATSGQPQPGRAPRISAAPAPPPVQKIIPGQQASFSKAPGTLGTVSQNAVSAIAPRSGGGTSGKSAPVSGAKAAAPVVNARPALVPAPAPAAARVASFLPNGTPKDQYKYAFGLLRQANYDKAEKALQEFVALHPKDDLVSNARYWLGETYYVRAAYVPAAETFLEGYQSDPKGAKAPDSLLKLGMSLAGLDKKREACAAFDKLIKDYPGISAGLLNTVTREKQKNSCS
ncbi:MAG: tol-pal system protein YbgF [Proteobacteria bacterium]|nr:tol-pal system protein YbgF [Pseudomonadota bacterium]